MFITDLYYILNLAAFRLWCDHQWVAFIFHWPITPQKPFRFFPTLLSPSVASMTLVPIWMSSWCCMSSTALCRRDAMVLTANVVSDIWSANACCLLKITVCFESVSSSKPWTSSWNWNVHQNELYKLCYYPQGIKWYNTPTHICTHIHTHTHTHTHTQTHTHTCSHSLSPPDQFLLYSSPLSFFLSLHTVHLLIQEVHTPHWSSSWAIYNHPPTRTHTHIQTHTFMTQNHVVYHCHWTAEQTLKWSIFHTPSQYFFAVTGFLYLCDPKPLSRQ